MEALAAIVLHWNSTSHQFDSASEGPGETVKKNFISHFDKKKLHKRTFVDATAF